MANYGTLRLKEETLDDLRELKDTFEESLEKKMTLDEFIKLLLDCCSKQEPEIWEFHQTKIIMKKTLQEKMDAAKAKRLAKIEQ